MTTKAHCMLTPQDASSGAVLTSATVNVYNPGTVTPISQTMYDRNGNVLSNPLASGATTGQVDFYLPIAQEVDLVISKSGYTTRTLSNVPVIDDASLDLSALLTTTGDIPYASGANTPARLALGALNTLLHGGASVPSYSALATADVAANAITQNQFVGGTTVSPTTASTTYVDLTDMAAALTTVGGDILAFFLGQFWNSGAGNAVGVALSLDGASEVGAMGASAPSALYSFMLGTFWRFSAPAAGTHTVKVRWLVTAGTGTAAFLARQILIVELKR